MTNESNEASTEQKMEVRRRSESRCHDAFEFDQHYVPDLKRQPEVHAIQQTRTLFIFLDSSPQPRGLLRDRDLLPVSERLTIALSRCASYFVHDILW